MQIQGISAHHAIAPEGFDLPRIVPQARKQRVGAERRRGMPQTGLRATSWRAMMIRCNSLVPSPMHSSGASR